MNNLPKVKVGIDSSQQRLFPGVPVCKPQKSID